MIGSVGVGMSLNRSIQANQVTRSAGHMYARGLNFSQTGQQTMLVRMATGLNLQLTGGDGVVYLTRAVKDGDQQCLDGGVAIASCTNSGPDRDYGAHRLRQHVASGQFVRSPASTFFNSNGDAAEVDYLKKSALVLPSFSSTLDSG